MPELTLTCMVFVSKFVMLLYKILLLWYNSSQLYKALVKQELHETRYIYIALKRFWVIAFLIICSYSALLFLR